MTHELSTNVELPLPEIMCLSRSEIDIHLLLSNVELLCDMVPSRLLDCSTVDFKDPARYLVCLAELLNRGRRQSAVEVLRRLPSYALQYLHYTFLIYSDPNTASDFRIVSRCQTNDIPGLKADTVVSLGTGSLLQWKETILANSNNDVAFRTRVLINKIQIHFERVEGLYLLFDSFRKIRLEDQSFILEEK